MKTVNIFFFIVGTLCLAQAQYVAPSTKSKFHQVLGKAKLQAPGSNTAATSAQLGQNPGGYASWYLHLQGNNYMQFQISGGSKRSELREMQPNNGGNAAWSVNGPRSMEANIALPAQASGLNEVTILQVHCGSGPALRVSWRRTYSQSGTNYNDVIISNVRYGSGNSQVWKKFLVQRSASTTNYRIEVNNKRVKVRVGYSWLLDESLNYWSGSSCYFKAGAYNNNPSSSTAVARSKFREIWW